MNRTSTTRGFTAPETRAAAARARELAEKSGNLGQLIIQVLGIWRSAFFSGDYPTAVLLADRIVELAQREGSPASFGCACYVQVSVCFYRGDLEGAEQYFARWGSFADAADYRQIPGTVVAAFGVAAFSAGVSGRADSARARIARAVAFARDSNNPYDLAIVRTLESWLLYLLREPRRSEDLATQALTIVQEHAFPFVGNLSRTQLGAVRAQLGGVREGIALMRQGLAGFAESGNTLYAKYYFTGLAEAEALDGRIDDALVTIEETLQSSHHELVFQPHALNLRGELRLKLGQTEMAEADFREAIALAQKMTAKSWELRATMSLARLLASQGHRDEARAMLAEIYHWFTEGFDTADLIEAKALLEELSES